jgi:phosphomannomutase
MKRIMDGLRAEPPRSIGDYSVSAVLDYKTLKRKDLQTGKESDIDCIPGNVVVFEFGDTRRRITVRPSGTEPNIKLYVQWFEESDATQAIADQYEALGHHINGLSKQFEGHLLEF